MIADMVIFIIGMMLGYAFGWMVNDESHRSGGGDGHSSPDDGDGSED